MSGPAARHGLPSRTPKPGTAAEWQAVADGPEFLEVLDAAGVDARLWAGLDDGQRAHAAELAVGDGWPIEEAIRIAVGKVAGPA